MDTRVLGARSLRHVPPPQGARHARCHATDLHSMLDTLPRHRLPDQIRYGSSSDSCPRSLSAACAMPSTTPKSATSASLVRRARAWNCITARRAPAHRLVYVVLPVWVSQPTRGAPYRCRALQLPVVHKRSPILDLQLGSLSSMVRRGATWYSRLRRR
ncbi:hypothetical protein QYE76_071017 [Lolium multiflorum]|uniref:Uncharacterized protein n=1 Tax=Lolium multiflorum TaxID=4521 RepID=A0AAD8SJ99_LOLMU|nr:hypothetical protein QYE76_071017 [Lolium multiflorum]